MDTSASAAAAAATDAIDALLERYLGLLHEYAGLRAELAAAQAGVFADLARANFAAERGLRYGADHYDGRMRASRRLRIRAGGAGAGGAGNGGEDPAPPVFAVVCARGGDQDGDAEDWEHVDRDVVVDGDENGDGDGAKAPLEEEVSAPHGGTDNEDEASHTSKEDRGSNDSSDNEDADGRNRKDSSQPAVTDGPTNGTKPEAEAEAETETETEKPAPRRRDDSDDPLRWFGLLAPPALRRAQARSVHAVGDLVPRLASVDAAMARLEIEVRRARKRRAKAEKAAREEEAEENREQQDREVGALGDKMREVAV